jgi:hypothetical protein
MGYTDALFLFGNNLGDSVAAIFLGDYLTLFQSLVARMIEIWQGTQNLLITEVYYPFLRYAFSLSHQHSSFVWGENN